VVTRPKAKEAEFSEGGEVPVAIPRVCAVMIPVPIKEEAEGSCEANLDDGLGGSVEDEKQPKADQEKSVEGDEVAPMPVLEVLPFRPIAEDYQQSFELQASNIDLRKEQMDAAMIHIPLLTALKHRFFEALYGLLGREAGPDTQEMIHRLVVEDLTVIEEYCSATRRDLLFINSY